MTELWAYDKEQPAWANVQAQRAAIIGALKHTWKPAEIHKGMIRPHFISCMCIGEGCTQAPCPCWREGS